MRDSFWFCVIERLLDRKRFCNWLSDFICLSIGVADCIRDTLFIFVNLCFALSLIVRDWISDNLGYYELISQR